MAVTLDRRGFLKAGGGAAATLLVTPYVKVFDGFAWQVSPFPAKVLANINNLTQGQPLVDLYPDDNSPIVLVKLGERAIGGIGPDKDVVAFSLLCTHRGCTVSYLDDNSFACPCHHSKFDAAKAGQVVIGQATEDLPQVDLELAANGDISAVGIRRLIYGRYDNEQFLNP